MKNEHVVRALVYSFLDDLRDSGITNMWGATPYLMVEFGFDKETARKWLIEWIESFDKKKE